MALGEYKNRIGCRVPVFFIFGGLCQVATTVLSLIRTGGEFFSVCWNEALSVWSDHCMAAGCRIRGVTVVRGGLDVAQAKPKPRPRGTHPSSRRRQPTVRRAARGCLRPGGRRPPGPDNTGRRGMGDDVWRGQKDGRI